MTNRRMDAIYFLAFLLVLLVGYWAASSDDEADPVASLDIPDFSLPSFEIEVPFDLPYAFVRFARPAPPALALIENTEAVRQELRSALLESSKLVEVADEVESVGPEEQLAAVIDGLD